MRRFKPAPPARRSALTMLNRTLLSTCSLLGVQYQAVSVGKMAFLWLHLDSGEANHCPG